MWQRWRAFLLWTTRAHWDVTVTKLGELDDDDHDALDAIAKSTDDVVASVRYGCVVPHSTAVVAEKEFDLFVDEASFFKRNDPLAPPMALKAEHTFTYYALAPSVVRQPADAAAYTVALYNTTEQDADQVAQMFHNLSFLNSDFLEHKRWSILPKHLFVLHRLDTLLDLVRLCG